MLIQKKITMRRENQMKKFIKDKKELITWAIYCCLTFTLILFHENWRDEAQAWLLARDCTILELIRSNEI